MTWVDTVLVGGPQDGAHVRLWDAPVVAFPSNWPAPQHTTDPLPSPDSANWPGEHCAVYERDRGRYVFDRIVTREEGVAIGRSQ